MFYDKLKYSGTLFYGPYIGEIEKDTQKKKLLNVEVVHIVGVLIVIALLYIMGISKVSNIN